MIPIKFRSNEICEEEERLVMKKTAKVASLILAGAMMVFFSWCSIPHWTRQTRDLFRRSMTPDLIIR